MCKEEDVESDEEDFQVANVVRRSSYRLDHAVPDPVTFSRLDVFPPLSVYVHLSWDHSLKHVSV